jgi:hypothetical protein
MFWSIHRMAGTQTASPKPYSAHGVMLLRLAVTPPLLRLSDVDHLREGVRKLARWCDVKGCPTGWKPDTRERVSEQRRPQFSAPVDRPVATRTLARS